MRVFVTGANGFIGSAVVQELIGAGHTVVGLARTDAAAKALTAAGARAHRGSLDDVASLRSGAGASDGVIHLAFIAGLSKASLAGRLRILFGGAPSGLVSRFLGVAVGADRRAIDVFGAVLENSGRPLITTFGTMGLSPGRLTTEADAFDPRSPGAGRSATEGAVQAWAARGVRAMVMRLPPSVHGDGDTGLVPQMIGTARKTGVAAYVGDGRNRWAAVHRLDAAVLFRLALEKGVAGARYHGVAEEGLPFREIAEVIGRRLNVPVGSKTPEQAAAHFGWLGPFVATDNPVSGRRTQERLGWTPKQPGLISDIDRPQYFAS